MPVAVLIDDVSFQPEVPEVEDRIAEYVHALCASARLGRNVVSHRVVEATDAVHAPSARPWPRALQDLLAGQGIAELYEHQARATDLIRSGRHVVVATPTASGKSLVYNLPMLEGFLADPESRALYLFPLKALAQDQLKAFERLAAFWPAGTGPRAFIYDGDTADTLRRKIRKDPPNVVLTNPEMLHLSICPFHHTWSAFLAGLSFVVVDEVHTYRGVMGSHMAQVFRRLRRICARYGVDPVWIFCSATIGNPDELARQLTGLDVVTVERSGAPQGRRHILFINPDDSPAHAAILLLRAALHRGLRIIVYVQSRKMSELICFWATQKAGRFCDRISAYRAGFLPEERREIEARMSSGELLAVISTSALELGIDIGELDLCLLVGYPGSVMATLQRGGRVGRNQRESAVVLIAGEDALDQYFMRNPQDFFDRPPEAAVINPDNPIIRGRHLECAAAELPLEAGEPWLTEPGVTEALERLVRTGRLFRSKDGQIWYAARKQPQRELNLRGSSVVYHIVSRESQGSETTIGFVDEHRACKENYPGAVYLHKGQSYVVDDFDVATRTVRVVAGKPDYYTRARSNKVTEIMEHEAAKSVWGTRMGLGRLKVTETVTGYEKRSVRGGKLFSVVALDLPPLIFETQGLWFEIPRPVQQSVEKAFLHFMGGIHALDMRLLEFCPCWS